MEMPILNFSENYGFKFKQEKDDFLIFDEIRKSYFILTPEEWVRQHFIHYFLFSKKVAKSQIIIEKKLNINNQTKRIDLLILKKNIPFLLLECKAPEIKINASVFEQAARYNSILDAKFVLLSNGMNDFCFEYEIKSKEYSKIQNWKDFIF